MVSDQTLVKAITAVTTAYLVWFFWRLVETERGCDERKTDQKKFTCRAVSLLWGIGLLLFVRTTLYETIPKCVK